jgi:hypothetical protein
MLPSGKFRTSNYAAPDGFRFPVKNDWDGKFQRSCNAYPGRYDPVRLPLAVLDKEDRRKLCKAPTREFRKSLRRLEASSDTFIYPTQSSVRVHQRCAHALGYIREAIGLLSESDDHSFRYESLGRICSLLPEIFREEAKCPGSTYYSLRNQLYFSMRRELKDHEHDQRSRREALTEPHISDLFP